jgi:hypothetical protein
MIMNACTRIFLSLTVVALAVLAGPLPTADARGGHAGGGHGGKGHPKPAAKPHAPAHRNPGRAIARRPGLNGRFGFRVGRPVGNYGLGRGFYGVNWYTPGYSSWYYPGYVYRTPVYVTNPTTVIYVSSPGFSGGFDTTVPASDPQANLQQSVLSPAQK